MKTESLLPRPARRMRLYLAAMFIGFLGLPLFWLPHALYAQDNAAEKPKNEVEEKPLQLPEIIIRGTESLSIRGGSKAAPRGISRLKQRELDQLNSLEKLPPPLMPAAALPTLSTEQSPYRGFVDGSLGMYLTADLLAGLSLQLDKYSLYARGGMELSGGHMDDAGYSRLHAGLRSEYVAPEKFWIFGGSRTVAALRLERQDYKLYALPNPEERGVTLFDFDVDSKGSAGGMDFNLGFGLDLLSLAGRRDADHFGVIGFLRMRESGTGFKLGGLASINIQSLNSDGLSLLQLALSGDYVDSALTLHSELGFDVAGDSRGESSFAPRLHMKVELELSESMTLRGALLSGLREGDFYGLWRENPYVDADADVAFEHVLAGIDANLVFHPHPRVVFSVGTEFALLNDINVFAPTSTASFTTVFRDGTRLGANAEMFWYADERTTLSGRISFVAASLSDEAGGMPYVAPIQLQTELSRLFGESVRAGLRAMFVGERQADLADSSAVDAFLDLGVFARIMLKPNFAIDVSCSNLLGQNIYIWRDYKEREIFARAGISWLW